MKLDMSRLTESKYYFNIYDLCSPFCRPSHNYYICNYYPLKPYFITKNSSVKEGLKVHAYALKPLCCSNDFVVLIIDSRNRPRYNHDYYIPSLILLPVCG